MNYRSCIDQLSVKCLSSIGHVSVMYRSTIGQVSVLCRSSDGRISVMYRSSIDGGILYRSTIGRLSIDIVVDIAVNIAAATSTEATYSTHDPPFLESVPHQFSSLPIFMDCDKVRKHFEYILHAWMEAFQVCKCESTVDRTCGFTPLSARRSFELFAINVK